MTASGRPVCPYTSVVRRFPWTYADWINSGLMSFFFLVVGLEARREFDIGEFRERPRIILPVLAGLGGMVGAIGLYLAINAGQDLGARLGRGDVD